MDKDFTTEDIISFFRKKRKPGERILEALDAVTPFISANFNTDLGRNLLVWDVNKYDQLLQKIVSGEVTDEERAEFRIVRERLEFINNKLNIFLKNMKDVKEVING